MSYNMYSNKQNNQIDPNYIYPRPYIDPMMYINPYMQYGPQYPPYQMDSTMNGYTTYVNTFADNPSNPDLSQMDDDSIYPTIEDNDFMDFNNMQGYPNQPNMNNMNTPNLNMPNMNIPNPNMGNMPNVPMGYPPGMFPIMYMMPNMMYPPGMFSNMYMMPNMMYPQGMFPGMFPGIPQINMEEFDEEEM